MSENYAQALINLGAATSIDVSKLSSSTLSSVLSHVRTLRRNGVELSREALGNDTVDTLNGLRDIKGRLLSSDYKRQIGMTIKRMFPDLQINLSQYKVNAYNTETRRASSEYLEVARKLLVRAAKTLTKIDGQRGPIDEQLSVYDTCIAILITSSTSLRIHEIMDLQMSHIKRIRDQEPISIRSKGGKNLRNVVPNDILLAVFSIVERNRDRCKVGANNNAVRANVKAYYAQRLRKDYIVLSSVDFMRKRLRELAAMNECGRIGDRSLGFNMFRSFVSTVLTEGGGHIIAQALNNHSSVNTTIDHYNVVGPRAAESAYDRLDELMREVMPVGRAKLDAPTATTPSSANGIINDSPSATELPTTRRNGVGGNLPFETPSAQESDRYIDIDVIDRFEQK